MANGATRGKEPGASAKAGSFRSFPIQVRSWHATGLCGATSLCGASELSTSGQTRFAVSQLTRPYRSVSRSSIRRFFA
jgi:hypothetical protein